MSAALSPPSNTSTEAEEGQEEEEGHVGAFGHDEEKKRKKQKDGTKNLRQTIAAGTSLRLKPTLQDQRWQQFRR